MLDGLPTSHDPRLLVGSGTFDDAGVLRLTPDLALVQSVDFFTPIVDEPRDFGRIAAANALSDIFAMGAQPVSALAVCTFPSAQFPLAVLHETLAGGLEVLLAEGVVPLGGHTIKGPEFSYGLAVTGSIHPDLVLTNAGARPGDTLVLTKPLGTGVLATALKRGELGGAEARRLVESMATTNRRAAELCRELGVHALTDITGYGLLGHALEMAAASGVAVELTASALPLLPGAREAASRGATPGGLASNREWAAAHSIWDGVSEVDIALACDPQTSGGLLAAVPPVSLPLLAEAARRLGVSATLVGAVREGPAGRALLLP